MCYVLYSHLILLLFTSIGNISEWVLWEHTGGGKRDPNAWKESMKQLCSFSTIEDFWRYFNHIPRPSEVFFDGESKKRVGPTGKIIEEYSLFKKGIEPEWGDPKNKTGGEWFFRSHLEPDMLNLSWQNLVLGVVGETIEDPSVGTHINGARVVDKGKHYPVFKIELWIDTKDPTVREKLRVRLAEAISSGLPPNSKLANPKFEWKDHS